MTKAITLNLDAVLVEKLERYAQGTGEPLEKIVGDQLTRLVGDGEAPYGIEISPRIRRMSGVLNLPDDFDYKKELTDILIEKHGS